jgi:hypothetical protein
MYWLATDRKLTREVLHRAARCRGLRPEHRTRRDELLRIVRGHDAARCIQRALRRHHAVRADVCPITLAPLPPGDARFTYCAPGGRQIAYCARALADYIQSSGDMRDPVTRLPYSADDLARLERSAGSLDISVQVDEDTEFINDVEFGTSVSTDMAAQMLISDLARVFEQSTDTQRGEYLVLHFAPMLHMLTEIARDGGEDAMIEFETTIGQGVDEVAAVAAGPDVSLLRAVVAVGMHQSQ